MSVSACVHPWSGVKSFWVIEIRRSKFFVQCYLERSVSGGLVLERSAKTDTDE